MAECSISFTVQLSTRDCEEIWEYYCSENNVPSEIKLGFCLFLKDLPNHLSDVEETKTDD